MSGILTRRAQRGKGVNAQAFSFKCVIRSASGLLRFLKTPAVWCLGRTKSLISHFQIYFELLGPTARDHCGFPD